MPHTYAEIQLKFMQEVRSIIKHEKLSELAALLEDNFIQDEDGKWYIPTWLSQLEQDEVNWIMAE